SLPAFQPSLPAFLPSLPSCLAADTLRLPQQPHDEADEDDDGEREHGPEEARRDERGGWRRRADCLLAVEPHVAGGGAEHLRREQREIVLRPPEIAASVGDPQRGPGRPIEP